MAHRRHSPPTRTNRHTLPASPSPTTATIARRRKYALRRSPNSRRRALGLLHPSRRSTSHATDSAVSEDDEEGESDSTLAADSGRLRPVLAALHQNLRRLPSRLLLAATSNTRQYKRDRDSSMRDVQPELAVQIGSKRKRVASSNENAGERGVSTRGSRSKRMKSMTTRQVQQENEEEASEMEIDTPTTLAASEDSDSEDDDSSDEHLLKIAPARQLLRLRKDELVHLYTSAGLSPPSSFESLTKPEIVDAIIATREDNDEDLIELPPSSPRGSEYSSEGDNQDEDELDVDADDGNVAGGEETDATFSSKVGRLRGAGASGAANPLRRRATVNDIGHGVGRPNKGRSLSMGQLGESSRGGKVGRGVGDNHGIGRRRASSRSSPTNSGTSMSHATHLPSPPATRTRSRKVSADAGPASTLKVNGKGKGKAKQVEFSDDIEVQVSSPAPLGEDDGVSAEDSELTDLNELEVNMRRTPRATSSKAGGPNMTMPSPRRLRSKGNKDMRTIGVGKGLPGDSDSEVIDVEVDRRVTPMRKAKGRIGSLREDSESVEEDPEVMEEDDGEESGEENEEENEEDEGEEDVGEVEEEMEDVASNEEEVDELVSSPSPTPPPQRGRRTPVKRRLRPRRVQTHTPPSDGDDEDCGEDADIEGSVAESDAEVYEDANEAPASTTPRKLRNGKIVGEEGDSSEEEEEEFMDADEDAQSIDIDAEGDTEDDTDEPMDDGELIPNDVLALGQDPNRSPSDIDLTIATTKTLVRLRRDDLVRLCETRDLEPVGTKPQLASALLEWRDRQSQNGFSSPSSAGTVRPPSTVRRRRKSSSGGLKMSRTPPVLLRSHHFHTDEPRTPPMSGSGGREQEPELELDLESLGLEDREIPPEKLTKLEKIGSGGFKDVFIGKFKGRRIAISEFRGQLSAMDIKELKLLGGFDHPNIVRFLGVSIPENTRETPVMIVSELCSNGDLFDYVRNVPPPSLHKVLHMMLDIARGLEYLHLRKPSVIHRDCKSSNILITSRGTAKIADFGLAKVKQSTRSMVRSLVGTVNWQAPELWHAHPKYNHKVDVFSCAMVYWEMLQWHITNKKFPWEGMNEHAIYDIVGAKRQRPSISGLRKIWSSELVDLIDRMWAHEHQDRPTMSEVVQELERMVHAHTHKK